MNKKIASKVKEILSSILKIENGIKDSDTIASLNGDDVDCIELQMALEETYNFSAGEDFVMVDMPVGNIIERVCDVLLNPEK